VLQDALTLVDVPGPPPTAFVANLPYNVAVPVLLRLLEHLPSLRTGLVMVQAEVADRLVAPPGSRTYGVPSVKAAWYADVRRAGAVGRTVFWPAPHVDSGSSPSPGASRRRVTASRPSPRWTRPSPSAARRCARPSPAGPAPRPPPSSGCGPPGIDPAARGEVLSVEDFARLAATDRP
jgi:16S rRNA (adenine1518-N6/adenine1519-N6)-dimethyltransferase